MRYNVNLDKLDVNTSHGKILSQIAPRSTVLECGCASGYMTRYMKEELNCDVYIVEYDREAFEIAKQYAKDGIAGDLMSDEWLQKFKDIRVDYVLFADVLEHLSDPLKAIRMTSGLLKEDGKIIVSLPNIGHNDIILKLLSGRWEYTPNGLLDETHIRFWGIYDLEPFFKQADLGIEKFDAVYLPSFSTEQYINGSEVEVLKFGQIMPQLDNRREGEIFQFVLTLRKQAYMDKKGIADSAGLPKQNTKGAAMASVYFDLGDGYSEENSLKPYLDKGVTQNFRIDIPENVRNIRFDPIENLCCAIKNLSVRSVRGDVECKVELLDAYSCGEYSFFFTTDPQIIIVPEADHDKFELEINMELVPFAETEKALFGDALHLKDRLLIDDRNEYARRLKELNDMLDNERENVAERKMAMQVQEQQLEHLQTIYQSLLEAYERQSSDTMGAISAAQSNVQSLIAENSSLRTQMQQVSDQLAESKGDVIGQKAELKLREKELETVRDNVQNLKNENSELKVRVQQVSDQLAESKEKNTELKVRVQQVCDQLAESKEKNIELKVRMQQVSEQLAAEEESAEEKQAELQLREKELESERDHVRALKDENTELKVQMEQVSEQYAAEKKSAEEKQAELQQRAEDLDAAQASIQTLMAEKAMLQQEVLKRSAQEQQLGQKLTAAHNQSAEMRQAYDKLMESYNSVLQSDSWRVTVPMRKISSKVRSIAQKNRVTNLGWRGLISLKQNGLKATWQKTQEHFGKKPKSEIPVLNAEAVYEPNIDFSEFKTDIKTLALYLPQYHEFKENNEWWGKGFTEWTNVRKGYSRFENHYQPRVPDDDIGYYDLTDLEALKKQVRLAKQHGVYGFAIYYYWFSGKRLMERPMDMLLEHKEIDFPFMAVWANENWTRTWDGQANHVLIAQEYSEQDPRQFILDLKKYMDDPRYIRVGGKPVIGLYDPTPIPNVDKVLQKWRDTARELGIGDILIWICQCNSNAQVMGVEDIVDGEYEFPPRGKGDVPNCEVPSQGIAYNYQALVEKERYYDVSNRKIPVYRGSMMQWDNSARRKTKYNCWINYSPQLFYLWNKTEVADLRRRMPEDQRFLFVNAWNEWGEGTYLEPDQKYGYANINALSRAIFDLPLEYGNKKNLAKKDYSAKASNEPRRKSPVKYTGGGIPVQTKSQWSKKLRKKCQIAVQAHIFYPDLAPEIAEKTNNIAFPFDLYVSTDSEAKAVELREYFAKNSKANKVCVQVLENKGRDVTPFIRQMSPVIDQYKYFCHIHSKKSLHNESGNIWREYLYENLLGSESIVSEIMFMFENDDRLGVVYPENMDVLRPFVEWGSNREIAQGLCGRMGMYDALPEKIEFPAGNMFWGRVEAVKNIFRINFADSDFPEEGDQIDGTTMHAIERLWLCVAAVNGFTYQETRSVFDNRPLLS